MGPVNTQSPQENRESLPWWCSRSYTTRTFSNNCFPLASSFRCSCQNYVDACVDDFVFLSTAWKWNEQREVDVAAIPQCVARAEWQTCMTLPTAVHYNYVPFWDRCISLEEDSLGGGVDCKWSNTQWKMEEVVKVGWGLGGRGSYWSSIILESVLYLWGHIVSLEWWWWSGGRCVGAISLFLFL